MMSITVAEDNEVKAAHMIKIVAQLLPSATFVRKRSFSSLVKALFESTPDLLLLDMSLPTFHPKHTDDNPMRPYAGWDILRRLQLLNQMVPTIVVTQLDEFGEGDTLQTLAELSTDLSTNFPTNYLGTVYYQPSDSKWLQDISVLIDSNSSKWNYK